MRNSDFKRRKFKGRPTSTIKIPEPPILVSVIENDIWIIESIEKDCFVCRLPSVAEFIRILEYLENPYIKNDYVRPMDKI